MSEYYKTSLFLQGAPLPQNFKGTPQEWYEAILQRIRIVAPYGFQTIVVGSLKPTSNQGPWLKDGTKLYVWDEDEADYVPLDISDSAYPPYWVQSTEPDMTDAVALTPRLWFKTDAALTKIDGVYFFINGAWQGILGASGTTANRPSDPGNLQQYYDTDISCLLHWERGQWRTVDGSRGDLKYVSWPTAEEALLYNPGWEVYGTGESDNVTLRGRLLVQATRNAGGSPTTQLSVTGGVAERQANANTGEEEHTLTVAEMPAHAHDSHNTSHVNTPGNPDVTASEYGNYFLDPTGSAGGDQPHNNLPPVHAVWCLRKT